MLQINAEVFKRNLLLTQLYCHLQMSYMVTDEVIVDAASVFRSFNPEVDGREVMEYGLLKYPGNHTTKAKIVKSVRWIMNPVTHDSFINKYFADQLVYKEQCLEGYNVNKKYLGKILLSQVDQTVIDGASSSESYYLFDDYDLPPIDTWFYLTKDKGTRLLFAWIPGAYGEHAQNAIDVNCVDGMNWFENWYELEHVTYYVNNLENIPFNKSK